MSDRALLARLCEGPASGAALAQALGITRSAVWKRIEALREAGVDVEAEPGRGACFRLTLPLVRTAMPDQVVWLPLNSSTAVHSRLGVTAGAVVRIEAGGQK